MNPPSLSYRESQYRSALAERSNLMMDSEILYWVDQNIPKRHLEFRILSYYSCCDLISDKFSIQYCARKFANNGLYYLAHIIERDRQFFQAALCMPNSQLAKLERAIKSIGYSFGRDMSEWRRVRTLALDEIARRDRQGTHSLPVPPSRVWIRHEQSRQIGF